MSNKDLLVKKSSEIKEMINSLSDKATDLNEGIMFFATQKRDYPNAFRLFTGEALFGNSF